MDGEDLQKLKKNMIDIMEDGLVTDNEMDRLKAIIDRLNNLAEIISELKLAGEKFLKGR